MISASLNRCKGMEDQVGDFFKQLAAKLELVLLVLQLIKIFIFHVYVTILAFFHPVWLFFRHGLAFFHKRYLATLLLNRFAFFFPLKVFLKSGF